MEKQLEQQRRKANLKKLDEVFQLYLTFYNAYLETTKKTEATKKQKQDEKVE